MTYGDTWAEVQTPHSPSFFVESPSILSASFDTDDASGEATGAASRRSNNVMRDLSFFDDTKDSHSGTSGSRIIDQSNRSILMPQEGTSSNNGASNPNRISDNNTAGSRDANEPSNYYMGLS
jgi:hypothetical protein